MIQTQDDSALDDLVPIEVVQDHLLAVWHWFIQAMLNLDIALQIGSVSYIHLTLPSKCEV